MRIMKIEQTVWPLVVQCKHHNTPVTFEVNMPSDMLVHLDYDVSEVPGANWRHAAVVGRHIWTHCPICGRVHELPFDAIPEMVRRLIPLDQSNKPVLGWLARFSSRKRCNRMVAPFSINSIFCYNCSIIFIESLIAL